MLHALLSPLPTPSITSALGATRLHTLSPSESPEPPTMPTTSSASPAVATGPSGLLYIMEYGLEHTILSNKVLTTKRVRKQRYLGLLTTTTDLSGVTLGLDQALSFALEQRKILVSLLPLPPKYWKAMLKHPHHQGFLKATQKEHTRIVGQGTFEPVASLPEGHNAIPTM